MFIKFQSTITPRGRPQNTRESGDDDVEMADGQTTSQPVPGPSKSATGVEQRRTESEDESNGSVDEEEVFAEMRKVLDNATELLKDAHAEVNASASRRRQINGPEDEPIGYFAYQRRRKRKHGQSPVSRSARNNKLLADIHAFSYLLLGVTSESIAPGIRRRWTPLPRGPPDPEGPTPTSVDEFTLAWNRSVTHPYNVAAIRNFIVAMIECPEFSYTKDDYAIIRSKWPRWFKSLRQRYLQETRPEGEMLIHSRREEATAYGRRIRLFYARRRTLSSSRLLRQHLEIVDQLGIDGMSSDEEVDDHDGRGKHFQIAKKTWRNKDATTFLRTLDAFRHSLRSETRGQNIRARYDDAGRESTSLLVDGLPKNAYDQQYLRSMEEWKRGEVNIIDDPDKQFDYQLPDFVHDTIARQAESVQVTGGA
ncbi:hypothetical protein FRC02_009027 [Tulasnella sp. 418]|nr:hypothetical protein FRC02_009027 [Tulasnella sp. 418]